ncbi:MAG: ribulose-phosphate 3-epimerase [Pseudobdellovibrionaceae bacterium]
MIKKIAPSLLSADFANLEKEVKALTEAGADWLHVDVMDGNFVPNLTIGPPVVKALKKVSTLPLDVHLMIDKPERYIEAFHKAGSDILTLHIESSEEKKIEESLKKIKQWGIQAGLTLRPGTPLKSILPYVSEVDLVLVMTVEPGFGGQSFMADQVEKIDALFFLRQMKGYKYLIEVDGGINADTAKQCKNADVFVAGNYVFSGDYRQRMDSLRYTNSI